jgi:hypothetical protein
MTDLRILPVATIRSLQIAWQEFDPARDEKTAATYAALALSAWHQGLISCLQYAEACETIADWLREHVIERRRVA